MGDSQFIEKEKTSLSYDENRDDIMDKDQELGEHVNEAEKERVLRRMDLYLLPFVSLLYLLSFLYVKYVHTVNDPILNPVMRAGIGPMLVCVH